MNCKQNLDLDKKYRADGSFLKQMINISKRFREFEQQALYTQLQQSSKSMIIPVIENSELSKILNNNQHLDYFILIGASQPSGNKAIEKTVLNIINLVPRPKKAYSIIYINTLAAKNCFEDFKKAIQIFPIQYFLNLDKIYVLNASFMSKATGWISFSKLANFITQKTIHVKSFKQLTQRTKLNAYQLIRLLPRQIQRQLSKKEYYVDHLLSLYAAKMFAMIENCQPHKFQSNEAKRQNIQPLKGITKSSILFTSPQKPPKRHIEDYQLGLAGPLPLQMLIYYFKQRDNLLNSEGIFRKSVSIDEQNQLLALIDRGQYDAIQAVSDPHLIANAIKRFLTSLKVPLIPYAQYTLMMEAPSEKFNQAIVNTVKNLSELRKRTMLILLKFFMEKVIPKQEYNKMSIKNISIVIGPCLMGSQIPSIKDLIYSQKNIAVMLIIFKQFDAIFGSKKQIFHTLRKSAKQFNKAYLQDKLGKLELVKDTECTTQSLQPSQLVLEPNFSKKEQKQQKLDSSRLICRMTHCLKQQLIQSNQKIEEEQFYDILQEQDEASKQLQRKQLQNMVNIIQVQISKQEHNESPKQKETVQKLVDMVQPKTKEQDFVDL